MKSLILFFLFFCQQSYGQFDELAYKEIGKRQKDFGAKEIKISLDSQIAEYKARYAVIAESLAGQIKDTLVLKNIVMPKTKFETITQRSHINDLQIRANAVLSRYNIDTASVYFSIVFCNCFNAQSLALGEIQKKLNNKWLVEYNAGFSIWAHKTSIFSANVSPLTGNIDSLNLEPQDYYNFITNPDNFEQYNSLHTFLLGDIGSALGIESDSIKLESCINPVLAGAISSGFSTFTLYHELAHIILGHHAKINNLSVVQGSKSKGIKIPAYYDFEYEADSLGLKIMLEELSSEVELYKQIPTSAVSGPYILSPLIFFSWLDLFQRFEDSTLGTHRGISTHPKAIDRRERLFQQYENLGLVNKSWNYADLIQGNLKFMFDLLLQMNESDEYLDKIKKLRKMAKQCVIE